MVWILAHLLIVVVQLGPIILQRVIGFMKKTTVPTTAESLKNKD